MSFYCGLWAFHSWRVQTYNAERNCPFLSPRRKLCSSNKKCCCLFSTQNGTFFPANWTCTLACGSYVLPREIVAASFCNTCMLALSQCHESPLLAPYVNGFEGLQRKLRNLNIGFVSEERVNWIRQEVTSAGYSTQSSSSHRFFRKKQVRRFHFSNFLGKWKSRSCWK